MGSDPLELLVHLAELGTPPDDGDAVLRVSAGLRRSLERIKRETFPFIAAGGGEIQFIFGPYGRGKTHFLKALGEWATRHGYVTSYVDIQKPFEDLPGTYRAIAASMMPPPGPRQLVSTAGITKVIEAQFTSLGPGERRKFIRRLKSDHALSPDFRNLVLAYCTEAAANGSSEDLADQLQALLANTTAYQVNLVPLYREHPELPRPLGKLSKRNAAAWLRSALSLPQVLGCSGLLVLFDETEETFIRSSFRHQQAHLAHVRTFVDHMATGAFRGCAIYYAVTEEFIDIASRRLGALSQRIERTHVPELNRAANPRAVWVNIDELTEPHPKEPQFFAELSNHIIEIGRQAGLDTSKEEDIAKRLNKMGIRYTDYTTEGRVREFVKEAATLVCNAV